MSAKSILRTGLLMGISLSQLACSVFGIRSEETPKYQVMMSEGNKEIRSYSSYIVAKTAVKGEFKAAQGKAFRILAGYIFGDNETKQNISMTAPVVQGKEIKNEKIAMTAPVSQTLSDEGWVMTFMMPSKYKIEDLPVPKDKRVKFEELPPKIFGVIRYSGLGRESTNRDMAVELRKWLEINSDYGIIAGPNYAGYDPPWTIPFLRRNEMMYELKAIKKR